MRTYTLIRETRVVWIAGKTLINKNQNKVFKLTLRRAGSIVINKIRTKWKLNSSPFNRHMFRYTQTSMIWERSALKGEENLTGRVSYLQSKLVWNELKKTFITLMLRIQSKKILFFVIISRNKNKCKGVLWRLHKEWFWTI